jgi:c-di-GMP-binding flagellar brake protein YcgR
LSIDPFVAIANKSVDDVVLGGRGARFSLLFEWSDLMEKSGSERRKFARLDLALSVSYRVSGQVGQPVDLREAISSDISLGGLRLMTPTVLENGTLLDLEIYLGEEGEITVGATGEVMWQNKMSSTSYETGVMIKGMPNDDKSRFMEFVFDQMAKVVTR